MLNRCNRSSWHARCYGGALRQNFGPAWSPMIWHKATGVRPGQPFTSVYRTRSVNLLQCRKSQQKPEVKGRARKRKQYGDGVPDPVPDVTPDILQSQCEDFIKQNVHVTGARIKDIERRTKMQSFVEIWKEERRIRLTAFNFGEVVKKSTIRHAAALVQRLLYPSFKGNIFTTHGLTAESATFKEYVQHMADKNIEVAVEPMGLVIDDNVNYLAASTDGKVKCADGSEGLLEVKNLLQKNLLTLHEAASKLKTFCLQKNTDGTLSLKRNHNYYFQCQGQLNILNKPWLDFFVRRSNPNQIHLERIEQDKI